jgi:phosphoenolpyruvate-protein kinase (PTS system EI component)
MIGMGLRKISIDPKKIGEVREAVGTIDTERARDAAKKAMRASLIDEIREILSVPSA